MGRWRHISCVNPDWLTQWSNESTTVGSDGWPTGKSAISTGRCRSKQRATRSQFCATTCPSTFTRRSIHADPTPRRASPTISAAYTASTMSTPLILSPFPSTTSGRKRGLSSNRFYFIELLIILSIVFLSLKITTIELLRYESVVSNTIKSVAYPIITWALNKLKFRICCVEAEICKRDKINSFYWFDSKLNCSLNYSFFSEE